MRFDKHEGKNFPKDANFIYGRNIESDNIKNGFFLVIRLKWLTCKMKYISSKSFTTLQRPCYWGCLFMVRKVRNQPPYRISMYPLWNPL